MDGVEKMINVDVLIKGKVSEISIIRNARKSRVNGDVWTPKPRNKIFQWRRETVKLGNKIFR